MPSGWWASLSPGGSSANALTPDGLSDLGGGADFHDTLVQVTRADGNTPGASHSPNPDPQVDATD